MQGVFIPLTRAERRALIQKARKELRSADDHARYILRSVLLGEQAIDNNKPVTDSNLAERTVNGFVSSQPS